MAEAVSDVGLLNDQWQRQQQKTFTAWVNSHLRKRTLHVDDVQHDLSDGRKLLQLMEVVGNASLPHPSRGNMRIHKIENVGKAFKFIKEKGVNLVSIGPEEIVDGNLKMILGMLWTIILRFEIQDISLEEMSAKDALLLWCQRKTAPYKNVDVQNFHMSWKDGLAFCALIHRHRPELIDYESLRKDNPRENFRIAFEAADKYLDIPPMLDAEDMITCAKPDERSVMTYVAAYYKAFAVSNKNEIAAKKITTVLETNRQLDSLIQEYESLVSRLLEWIPSAVDRLNQRPGLHSVEDCQAKFEEFNKYKTTEYPPKLEEKGDVESQYSTLQTKLRLSGRPTYVPQAGHLVADINAAWQGLEVAESQNREWLSAELKRNQLCEYKAERFNHKAATHESWTNGRVDALAADDYVNTNLAGVQALKKQHEAFQSDLTAHEARVHEIGTLANDLDELNYVSKDAVNQRYADIYETWQTLLTLTEKRQQALEEAERVQQRLDELRLQFAKQVAPLNNFLDECIENLTDRVFVTTVEEVQELQTLHTQFTEGLTAPQGEYEQLASIQTEMTSLGATSNPYSSISMDVIESKWQQVQSLLPQRDQQLADEVARQQNNESLRCSWADKAKEVSAWIQQQNDAVRGLASGAGGHKTLEEQLNQLKAFETAVADYKPSFDELEDIHAKIQENLVFDNPHSSVSIEDLRGQRHGLSATIKRLINEINNQILTRDLKNLTEEQLKEYRDSFSHFDKDGSKMLDRLEFRACLISLGYDIPQRPPEDSTTDTEFNRVLARVDPNNDGRVSFEEYITFMAEEHADAETSAQLLDAFKVLAGDRPYLTADELRRDLSAELAEYCIANMSPYADGPEGALDFKAFAQAIYGESTA